MSIPAHGFSTGPTLWAHVKRGQVEAEPEDRGAERGLRRPKTRRRLLPRNAAVGVHTIQVDTFRRYRLEAAGPIPLHGHRHAASATRPEFR